jgi:hypothetical protein
VGEILGEVEGGERSAGGGERDGFGPAGLAGARVPLVARAASQDLASEERNGDGPAQAPGQTIQDDRIPL